MEYLIFKIMSCDEVYIDAYRIDDKPHNWIPEVVKEFEEFDYVSFPSRRQAIKQAYKNWINKDSVGFREYEEQRYTLIKT